MGKGGVYFPPSCFPPFSHPARGVRSGCIQTPQKWAKLPFTWERTPCLYLSALLPLGRDSRRKPVGRHCAAGACVITSCPPAAMPLPRPSGTCCSSASPQRDSPSPRAAFPVPAASDLTLKPNPDLGMGWVTCHPLFHCKAHTDLVTLGNRNEIQIHRVLYQQVHGARFETPWLCSSDTMRPDSIHALGKLKVQLPSREKPRLPCRASVGDE